MSERLPDDDNTLEDGPELLRQARAGATPPSDRPNDETIAADPEQLTETDPADTPSPGGPDDDTIDVDPHRLTEADLADAPSQDLPDDDTIDVDPELLRQVAASADRGAHHGDETVVRDPESLREAQAVTVASHAAPQESRRRRWLVALAIPIVLVGALAALAASQGWFGNGAGGDLEETTEAASSSTPSDDDESAEAGGGGTPISDETTDPPETVPPDEIVVIDDEEPEEPNTPEEPNIDASGGKNSASASWSADDNGSSILEWEIDDDNMPGDASTAPNATSHTWTNVPAGTFTITVRARNAGGWSAPATTIVTVAQSPPDTPNIDASGGKNSASASWSADDDGSSILEWEIDDDNMPGDASTAPNATSHTWTNVPAGTFTITVRARNAGGWSAPATTIVTVAQSPPDTPNIDASGGKNSASASWSADDDGSSILEWEIDDDNMPGDASTAPNATSHTWTNVPAGTFTITVRARNAGGWSAPATTIVTVAQSPPDTPNIDASGGKNSASASWSADDDGSSILEWEIDDDNMPGDASTAPNATSHTWTNVPAGTFTITVRARNAGGWSAPATTIVTVAQSPPDTPNIDASGGKNSASASWSADDDGSSILEWEIDDDNMPGDASTAPNATSHTWTNVPAGTFTITVRARNAGGWSAPATTIVTVAQSPPDTPNIDASGGKNSASANWSADDNGSPIREWEINDDNMPGGPGRTATSHTWTNVNAGTHTITVRARNAGGWGPRASATVRVTAPTCPDRPSIRASGGENRASANWSADDNGSPILEWDVDDGGMRGGPGRTATSYQWTNVAAGTYTITVRARNDCGWSPRASVSVTVTAPEPTVRASKGDPGPTGGS